MFLVNQMHLSWHASSTANWAKAAARDNTTTTTMVDLARTTSEGKPSVPNAVSTWASRLKDSAALKPLPV